MKKKGKNNNNNKERMSCSFLCVMDESALEETQGPPISTSLDHIHPFP